MTSRVLFAFALLAVVSCADQEGPNISGVDDSQILAVQIQPAVDTIFIPDTIRPTDRLQLTAKATGANRAPLPVARFVWTTKDSAVAVVDSFGLVRPTGLGTTVISASASRIGTATIVVAPITSRLALSPRNDTLFVDDPIAPRDSLRLTATALDTSGLRIAGVRFSWASSIPTVATIDSAGMVRAVGLGQTGITVRAFGTQTLGSITVLPLLQRVVVSDPAATPVLAGDSAVLTARAFDYANTVTARKFVWSSLAPAVATVDSLGHVTFVGAGTALITATTAFRSDTVSFTVEARTLAKVDVGNDFACGISANGRAWCWGKGTRGQLGSAADSTCFDDNVLTPGRLPCAIAPKPLSRPELAFTQIAVGDSTACGISTARQVYCWGDDTFGQVGNGSAGGGSTPRLATVGTERFTTITAGAAHACALNLTGRAYCWGIDSVSQLGNNRRVNSTTPIPVSGPDAQQENPLTFTSISAGAEHTCAIDVNSVLWCWGRNSRGALGDTAVTGIVDYPNPVATAVRFSQVSAGRFHTCAVSTLNDVYCWGANDSRQSGDPSAPSVFLPRLVLSGVKTVAAGSDHTCAILQSGAAQCWGSNEFGRLGRGEPRPAGFINTPGDISSPITFTALASGRRTTCGIDTVGTTWCWGSNTLGTAGNQIQAVFHSIPQQVGPLR